MDTGKKKYLEQNPSSRRLLFEQMIMQIASLTLAIDYLMTAHKTRRPFLILPYNRGLEESAMLVPLGSMTTPELTEPARYFGEYLITYRLALYGERNAWLEEWPDLVDLAGLPPLAQYPTRPAETASNEATGP